MVYGHVGLFKNGCKLKLTWSHFVVPGFDGNSEQMALKFDLAHKLNDALRDATEVVVLHLLALRRRMAHECASRHHEVRARVVKGLIDQKVLLLPSKGGVHFTDVFIKVLAYGSRCMVDCL